jgi:4-alpha-glucanotransferase
VDEHPNWRRRLGSRADALLDHPDVAQRVEELASERPRQ